MKNPWKHLTRKNKSAAVEPKEIRPKGKKTGNIKKRLPVILFALLITGGIVGGIIYYNSKNQTKVDVYPITTLNSASWWEDDSSLTGTLVSDYVQSVKLKNGQEVEKIYVHTGDNVKVGDTLLKYNIEEQELELQLKELQIKSQTLAIENMQKELDKLKGTKTTGALDSVSGYAFASPYHIPGVDSKGIILLAENEAEGSGGSDEPGSSEEEPSTKDKEATSATEPTESTKSTESDPTESTKSTESTGSSEKTESTKTPSSETTTEEKPVKKDIPTTKTITSLDQRGEYSSGDGKSADKPYVFLLVKKEVEVTEKDPSSPSGTRVKKEKESIGISGELIKKLIDKKIYAVFKEYDSISAYEKDPGKPSSQITIKPNTYFCETISDKAKYTIPDLKDILITISKLAITPSRKEVTAGKSYSFKAQVTGRNVRGLTAKWKVSGNKAKDTIMSGGTLLVSSTEKAKKIKVTVTVNEKKASMTLKVKKASSSDNGGNSGSSGKNNGGNSGYGGGGSSDDSDTYTAAELREAIAEKEEEIASAKTELNEAKIDYEEAKKEVEAATIKSRITGRVESACTIDDLPEDDTPAIVVRSDDGIYVKTQVNEMDLDTVKVGGTILCTTWDTEEQYEAVVKEISDYPVSNSNSDTEGNPNSSFYPVVAYIEKAEGLNPGDTVNIKYSSESMGTVEGASIYLQKAYVRSDSDGSYVYKDGEGHRLVKQYIKTGKTLNGQYMQILEGLTEEDYIAFPYGNKVYEGAKTKVSENEENIIY